MGPYLPLFSVDVEHDFFGDRLWRDVRFEPSPATRALINRAGLLLRRGVSGFALYYDRARLDALKLLVADANGALGFVFKAHVDDTAFKNYSEPLLCDPAALACFDSDNGVSEAGRIRLHRQTHATGTDLLPIESDRCADLLEPRDLRLRPAFVVNVTFRPARNRSLEKSLGAGPPCYLVRFAARQTYWTYYLLGTFADRGATIVDLDNGIGFEPLDRVSLSDRRPALAFRSKVAIPLRQRSTCRFQLRQTEAGRSRVLVSRLPVAGAGPLNRRRIGGEEVLVSEIYVND